MTAQIGRDHAAAFVEMIELVMPIPRITAHAMQKHNRAQSIARASVNHAQVQVLTVLTTPCQAQGAAVEVRVKAHG